jgi:hypothetical protein
MKLVSSQLLASDTEGAIVTLDCKIKFKSCKDWAYLELPFCCQEDYQAHLVAIFTSPNLWESGVRDTVCFLLFSCSLSVSLCFHSSCQLFYDFQCSLFLFSEYILFFVILTLLIHRLACIL